ncbi:U3 small nucleolar ribonucleoprotein MPP10 [Canna indica]|uniref:U3 small nucleolar ribonucleoprotein protein MPP10 n=1 Tax=Canna indica TaxID=4628 RepID=A0AAQ3L0P6_9LILI|nr:U3 small nucleolar ribonucleoprotein MPP10 [Canna indica]
MAANPATVTALAEEVTKRGEEALERLRSADPPVYLSPSPDLAQDARAAALHLFSSLVPHCPKPPLDALLVGPEFDAEQIWCQIDLLSRPLLSVLRRELNRIERDPPACALGSAVEAGRDRDAAVTEKKRIIEDGEGDEEDGDESEGDEEEEGEDGTDVDEEEEEEEEEEDDDDDDRNEDEGEENDAGEAKGNRVEDKFLKIKDLEEYLVKEEEKEYGLTERKEKRQKEELDEEEDGDDEEEDDEEDDLDLGDLDSDGDDDPELAENARYADFFGGNKKKQPKQNGIVGKRKRSSSEVSFLDDPESTEMDVEAESDDEGQKVLSTHEKELQKLRSKIEQMEKANLEPKSWTMQGEVTAASRPKNSALEVDLDFEHNVRPAPVITEEVTASLEDMIRKRIIEGHFDDVQKAPELPSKAPKQHKELDDNKSKKGLAEIYEEEYAQKAGLAPALLSASDTLKNEASMLFKKLCSKLDALSHFHFAPKPVIEDMSIQVNVPALAMEEIAPLAVSDAAMLAPEEIFEGKGDIKEEAELTKADRKRKRANKKRRFKAQMTRKAAKKATQNANPSSANAKPDS